MWKKWGVTKTKELAACVTKTKEMPPPLPEGRKSNPGLLPARLRIATAPTGTIITARPVAAAAAVHSPANSLVW